MIMEYLAPVVEGCQAAFRVSLEQAKDIRKLTEDDFEKLVESGDHAFRDLTICFKVVDTDEMYMVGDDLNNDVLAGQVVGMTGVLVRTGKFRQDTLDRWAADEFAMQPNHVIDSVADLPQLLGF